MSAKLVKLNNTLKSGFFGLKPSRDQDGSNKKKFSQIGPAVPELLSFRQTDPYYFAVLLILFLSL